MDPWSLFPAAFQASRLLGCSLGPERGWFVPSDQFRFLFQDSELHHFLDPGFGLRRDPFLAHAHLGRALPPGPLGAALRPDSGRRGALPAGLCSRRLREGEGPARPPCPPARPQLPRFILLPPGASRLSQPCTLTCRAQTCLLDGPPPPRPLIGVGGATGVRSLMGPGEGTAEGPQCCPGERPLLIQWALEGSLHSPHCPRGPGRSPWGGAGEGRGWCGGRDRCPASVPAWLP